MEPVLHFALPFALASLLGLRFRWALLAGVIATLPDFDIFFYEHRSISHSIILPLSILVFVIILRRSQLKHPLLLASLAWASHIILDFTVGFSPILWPLSDKAYQLVFDSRLSVGSSYTIKFDFSILEKPYDYGFFEISDAPIYTAEGLAISLTLITLALAIERRKERVRPSENDQGSRRSLSQRYSSSQGTYPDCPFRGCYAHIKGGHKAPQIYLA